MKKSILVAVVYIILFTIEILVYYIFKESATFFYGFILLIAFVITFGSTLDEWK